MSNINNHVSGMSAFQNRDNMRGLPFYGQKGDFNFVTGRSQFTPGVSIKLLALKDMSRQGGAPAPSELDNMLSVLKLHFRPGDRVRGKEINSFLTSEEGRTVIGKLDKFDVDRRNNTIRALITDPETLEKTEIYLDTMERIVESAYFAKSFSQFIGS